MRKFGSFQIAVFAVSLLLLIVSFALSDPWFAPFFAVAAVSAAGYLLLRGADFAASAAVLKPQPQSGESAFTPVKSLLSFKDVAGLRVAREEIEEIVDYFKNPSKYRRFGVKPPQGVLLSGPPGVGKTLLAKVIAGETKVPFFYASGSSFAHLYVGVGPKRVQELFATARKNAPSIIFIDEIDAVGKARGGMQSGERENTLNQLLTEMDGFESSSAQLIVIAATNRIEMLDAALLRSGRFDRRIEISLPNHYDRLDILKIYFKDREHNVDLDRLALQTVGFSGAALATLVNESALNAIKREADLIEQSDVDAVKEKVISLKRSSELLENGIKEKLAVYQTAKAIAAKRAGLKFDAVKLSSDFLPRPKSIITQEELFATITAFVAGLAYWRMSGEQGVSFSEADIAEAKGFIARYESAFNPEGTKLSLMDKALKRAEEIVDKESIQRTAKLLLEKESVAFDDIL
ncbi:MAG: AAA family ATPase [Helicobacteraceae bacterium]|nr:AAA family ATPase [Helicobacteraceae bacterium]